MAASPKFTKHSDTTLLRKIIALARPYTKQFAGATGLAIFLATLGPARPLLIQYAVDNFVLTGDQIGLMNITIILILILIGESFCRYLFIYSTGWLGQNVIKNLRVKVFNHITGYNLRHFDTTAIGTSTTRTINDIETINNVFTQGIIQIIADLLTIIVVITAMLVVNWKLALISLAVFPLIILATYIFKEGVKSAFQRVRTQVSLLNAFLQEHITGMKIVQIFSAEQQEREKFVRINEEHKKANIAAVWQYSVFFPVVEIITAGSIALMVWYAGKSAIDGTATIGTIFGFLLFLNMLFRPLRMLADKFNTLQMGIVSADRIFGVLEHNQQIENNGKFVPEKMLGDIRFENVWFAYRDEDWVLKDVSFHVKPGETMAIVGPTGAGKSSIINILSRFYEISKGRITIDGVDIKEYELPELRKRIGMVLQDVFLFSGSIKENITLRNEAISDQAVIKASEIVGASEFIKRLPGEYNYDVMERGATLSMGQRQLISFIRTLVYDPAILVLDEATSSIDTESEILIENAISTLIADRTSIVIAHRLSTIRNANKILVLDKGQVVESGSHEELLAIDGHYRKLYDMQFNTKKAS
ncbi:MAG: ATP-binding cassette subfamily B multidrug efflux pump [Limisphaerales bacterium]|jgi:ATP-binding cassette subfamily B multidrug efflux pump